MTKGDIKQPGWWTTLKKYVTPSSIQKLFGYAQSIAFVIEYWVYAMYFLEEATVLIMRCYSDAIYQKDVGLIGEYQDLDLDPLIKQWSRYLAGSGMWCVYCYNAYASYLFSVQMWREYGNIKMGKGMMTYTRHGMFEPTPDKTGPDMKI